MDYYKKYNLKEVINASGKMTALGVSKYSDETVSAQKFAGQHFFVMDELIRSTGKFIADLIGTEDAHIVSAASSGIAQTVAGIIGQGNHYHAYHPYSDKIKKREIILPKGHNVDYGTPVEIMVQTGGGKVVEAGYANMCHKDHIEMMITEETAAILYIKSHHTVQKSMLSLEDAIEVAHRNNLPLILDAAAEQDLFKYSAAGADLIIYSGAKAFEGTSSGLVIGKAPFVEWTRLQSKGIGRAMKIGKENILGLTTAIENYIKTGAELGESMKERLAPFVGNLNEIEYISSSVVQDGAGRDIFRAKVVIEKESPLNAVKVIEQLKIGNPAIYSRDYQANNGIIEFDIRAVNEKEMNQIVTRLREILK